MISLRSPTNGALLASAFVDVVGRVLDGAVPFDPGGVRDLLTLRAGAGAELGARGFKFVGPTIVYAFMQATGMVNDHLVTCFRHEEVRAMGESR